MERITQSRLLPKILYTSYRFLTIQCKLRFFQSRWAKEDENNQGMELNHRGGRRRNIRNASQGLGFKDLGFWALVELEMVAGRKNDNESVDG